MVPKNQATCPIKLDRQSLIAVWMKPVTKLHHVHSDTSRSRQKILVAGREAQQQSCHDEER